jgi:hypothetical protein
MASLIPMVPTRSGTSRSGAIRGRRCGRNHILILAIRSAVFFDISLLIAMIWLLDLPSEVRDR